MENPNPQVKLSYPETLVVSGNSLKVLLGCVLATFFYLLDIYKKNRSPISALIWFIAVFVSVIFLPKRTGLIIGIVNIIGFITILIIVQLYHIVIDYKKKTLAKLYPELVANPERSLLKDTFQVPPSS